MTKMDEYISRKTAASNLAYSLCHGLACNDCPFSDYGAYKGCKLSERIKSIPAADVVPVVHARWVYNKGDNIPYCSACMMPQDSECNYCPSCGARMDGGWNELESARKENP